MLEAALCSRDVNKVLLLFYRLVQTVLPDGEDSDVELLRDFFQESQQRLHLPELELKHIWYADQWHDLPQNTFEKQDLARAELCVHELEAGEYYARFLRWPWNTNDR